MDYKTIGEIIAIAGGIISIAGVIPVVTRHIIRQWHRTVFSILSRSQKKF